MRQSFSRLIVLGVLILSSTANAKILSGVTIPEIYQHQSGQELTLQGASIRSKFMMDIYAASFYSEQLHDSATQALKGQTTQAMRLSFIYPKLSIKKFQDGWQKGILANNDRKDIEPHQQAIEQFIHSFKHDLKKGDELILESSPQQGMRVVLNGSVINEIQDPSLFKLLLSTWLGPKPPSQQFKKALIEKS